MRMLDALRALARHRGDAVVVPTMSSLRLWPLVSDREALDLPLFGAMGKASSLGLGVALARPERRVVVLDGDGSLLMNLGSLVTIANLSPRNLVHVVFQNDVYATTGGQPVPGAGGVDFAGMALAAGYRRAATYTDLAEWEAALPAALEDPGPALLCLRVEAREEMPPFPARKTAEAWKQVRAALIGREATSRR
ncbi:MAG TPA: thiamine pyrophosphate-dependent enzyme [Chloroflexota bacterium]